MKRGFNKAFGKPEGGIHADDGSSSHHVASHPLKSKLIRGLPENTLKRGYVRQVVLPPEGIYADDGFLFHHVSSEPHLNTQMITRLCEHGIDYKYYKRFAPEEDEIIRNNWKEFAEEYNIPMNDVLVYTGMGDHDKEYIPQEVIDRRYFCENTNFWPRMCMFPLCARKPFIGKGLKCRSGRQVKERMRFIFHESVLNGNFILQYGKRNGRTLKFADLINYVEACPRHKYIQRETVTALGINLHKMQTTLSHHLSRGNHGKVERSNWKCLWNTVDRLVEVFPITKTFGQMYRAAIMRRSRSELDKLTKSINFRVISNIMLKSLKSCKEGWSELTEELLKEYNRAYDTLKIGSDAFEEACNKVFSERAFITPDRYSLFLRLLSKCLKDDSTTKTKMKKKYFHMDRLANMLLSYGISGFHVYDPSMSEVECIYSHAKINLSECDKELPSSISSKLTLKEKIQLFTTAYDMQFRHIESLIVDLYPIEGENCKKNYVITKDGFPCFKMRLYLRVVFKYLDSQRVDNSSDEGDLSK